MKNNKNFILLIPILLVVGFLISQDIIFIHDETLVLINFILFISAVVMYGKDSVTEELLERSTKISKEFDTYFSSRKETLNSIILYYKNSSTLVTEIVNLFEELKAQIDNINSKKENLLKYTIINYINQKLKNIVLKETEMLQKLQLQISSNFNNILKTEFKDSLSFIFPTFIDYSISKLINLNSQKIDYNGNKRNISILTKNLYN